MGSMKIILDLTPDPPDGRLVGTATAAGDTEPVTFSGTLELIARIEELSRSPRRNPPPSTPHR
jgi:hypothetical protein